MICNVLKECCDKRSYALEELEDVELLMLIVILELLEDLPAAEDSMSTWQVGREVLQKITLTTHEPHLL